MHNLTKIKLFRLLLLCTFPIALIFIYPFALLRKKNPGNYFFFFDRYVIGGAQKVHIDILKSIPGIHKEVYFTRYSPNDKLKQDFYGLPETSCRDIHFWCDNLLIRLFTVHYYVFYLNRYKNAVIFSSNSTFFYDMLYFLNKENICIELLHNFTYGNNGMEFFGLANHKQLDYRLCVDSATVNNIKKQYAENNIPDTYNKRIVLIEPAVDVPQKIDKDFTPPLKVLYAGRGGAQKRIYLLDKIATASIEKNLPIEFHFAGTMMDELSDYVKQRSVIHGEINTQKAMYALYQQCHALLMTSAYEGFPMLIKEGMANGCIPVVTALEGNKMHLSHNKNALLIDDPENEQHVIESGLAHLKWLSENTTELKQLSERCYLYAAKHFDRNIFTDKYRTLLTKTVFD